MESKQNKGKRGQRAYGMHESEDSKLVRRQVREDKKLIAEVCAHINKVTGAKVPPGTYGVSRQALARVRTQVPPGEYHGAHGNCIPRPPRPGGTDPFKAKVG